MVPLKKMAAAALAATLPFASALADEKNPFAEWNTLRQKTDAATSGSADQSFPATSSSRGLHYFPAGGDKTAQQPPTPTVVAPARRESMGSSQTATTQIRSDGATEVLGQTPFTWPSERNRAGRARQAARQFSESGVSGIQRAAMQVNANEVESQQAVTPVSHSAESLPADLDFEAFIAEQLQETPAPQGPADQAVESAPLALPNNAAQVPAMNPAGEMSLGRNALPASAVSGPQTPSVTLHWESKSDLNVGQECLCELVVVNTGETPVADVVVESAIPAGIRVMQAEPSPAPGATTPSWKFEKLSAGEEQRITLTVIPQHRGAVPMTAFVRFTGQAATSFEVQEPMIAVQVDGPSELEVGRQAPYVVKVTNPGTGIARNVKIQAAVPKGLEHRNGSLLTIDIGTLDAGESRQARLNLTGVTGGPQSLGVRVLADNGLSDQSMLKITVAEPRLNLAVSGPQEQMADRSADFQVTVRNESTIPSANVRARYKVPVGCEFVSADRGGKYNPIDSTVDWFVGTLQPGQQSQFQITLKPTITGEMKHQAGVISEHGRVTMSDHVSTVEGIARLNLLTAASHESLKIGDEVTFEIRISNDGSRAADGVGVSCELPLGLELISADGPAEYIEQNGVMVFRALRQLDTDADVVFTVKAICRREGDHQLRVRVASESISNPLISEETARVAR